MESPNGQIMRSEYAPEWLNRESLNAKMHGSPTDQKLDRAKPEGFSLRSAISTPCQLQPYFVLGRPIRSPVARYRLRGIRLLVEMPPRTMLFRPMPGERCRHGIRSLKLAAFPTAITGAPRAKSEAGAR